MTSGCGDHSCYIAPPAKGVMGTNGGCRCDINRLRAHVTWLRKQMSTQSATASFKYALPPDRIGRIADAYFGDPRLAELCEQAIRKAFRECAEGNAALEAISNANLAGVRMSEESRIATPCSDADFLRGIAADYEYANVPSPTYDRLMRIASSLPSAIAPTSEDAEKLVEEYDAALLDVYDDQNTRAAAREAGKRYEPVRQKLIAALSAKSATGGTEWNDAIWAALSECQRLEQHGKDNHRDSWMGNAMEAIGKLTRSSDR